jgi:hypothetical protein
VSGPQKHLRELATEFAKLIGADVAVFTFHLKLLNDEWMSWISFGIARVLETLVL